MKESVNNRKHIIVSPQKEYLQLLKSMSTQKTNPQQLISPFTIAGGESDLLCVRQCDKHFINLEKFEYLNKYGELKRIYSNDKRLIGYIWEAFNGTIPFFIEFNDDFYEIGVMSNYGEKDKSPRFVVFEIFKLNTKNQRINAVTNIERVACKSFDELFEDEDWVSSEAEYQEKIYKWLILKGCKLQQVN